MSVNAVWFEIPSINFERAVTFDESVLHVSLRRETIGGAMAMFPANEGLDCEGNGVRLHSVQ